MWNIASHAFIDVHLKPTYNFSKTRQSDKFPSPPFIVVSNHGTFFDPWMIGKFSHTPFAFMTNDDGFRGKGISQWYLKSIGAFPKKKGASDYKAMKTTIELLKGKYPVCIFPEGQTTWDGETQLIYRGIEKIIKKFNVPLVTVRFQGNFLTKPWWADFKRHGKILVNITTIGSEEISTLSSDQIFDKIKSSIYQNDIKDPVNLSYPFRGTQLAQGLERFVWICMHCGKEDALITEGNDIICSSCKSAWHIDAHCRLSTDNPQITTLNDLKDWSDYHKEKVLEKVISSDSFSTETPAMALLCENDSSQFIKKFNEGILQLTKDELRFSTQDKSITWPVEELEDYVVQKKDTFEFRHKNKIYRVLFDRKSPMKWVYYLRYLRGFTECEKRGYL